MITSDYLSRDARAFLYIQRRYIFLLFHSTFRDRLSGCSLDYYVLSTARYT